MLLIITAALLATIGFASGDVFTAVLARRVSGKASMLLLTSIKLAMYLPFMLLAGSEFNHIDPTSWAWIIALGLLFTIAYAGFNMALQISAYPALVGVIAGCFPATAAIVTIFFLHQRPSATTILLLITVLAGVITVGLPDNWRSQLKIDKGLVTALVPFVCWGVYGALLHEPINRINEPYGWFVVQSLIAVIMTLSVGAMFNRQIPDIFAAAIKKRAVTIALAAGVIIGLAEALLALALGSGRQVIAVETLLGSYPAVYFLIAQRLFKERLSPRQWVGIFVTVVSVVALSVTS